MQLTGRPARRLSHILRQWLSIGMRLNSALRLDSVKVSMPAVWPASLIRQAVVRRALFLLLQLGARCATVGGFEQDVTGAMAQAAPRARPQTQAPGRPHRHLAVQRRFCKTCRSHEDRKPKKLSGSNLSRDYVYVHVYVWSINEKQTTGVLGL